MWITLTPAELRIAAQVEIERRVENICLSRRSRYGAMEGDWSKGIEGAAAEMALAKSRGIYWSGAVGSLRAKDVGFLQVRSTAHPDGCLILHEDDSDDDIFVLAIGIAPTFRFIGWLRAREGKLTEFWRDPLGGRPAFFIPQDRLHQMPLKAALVGDNSANYFRP